MSERAPAPTDARGGALLRRPDFRRLYATRLLSQIGDGSFQAALASFILFNPNNATTAASAAGALAAVLLPYSVVGPFAGVLLDRWSRARVLVWCGILRALLLVGVAALALTGHSGPLFYAGALLLVSANRFVLAALPAALPRVVARRQLVLANSVTTTSGTVIALVGGGIGTGLSVLLGGGGTGSAAALAFAAVGYLCSSVAAAGFLGQRGVAWVEGGRAAGGRLGPDPDPDRPATTDAIRRVAADIVAGARHIASRRPAAHALTAIAAHRFCYGISTVATLLLYRNYFTSDTGLPAGIGGLALVLGVSGVGFLLGAVVTPRITGRIGKPRWVVVCLVIAGVAEVVFGAPYAQGPFLVAALVLGFVAQAVKVCVDTTLQETTDDAFRGRVFSFYDILFNVVFVLAAVFAALTLPASGKSYPVLGVVAAGYLATAIWYAVASRRDMAAELAAAEV